jgi:L-malate glycosyltransferase
MKILHLLSNHKWTERSELVVDLACAQKSLGLNVRLVCGERAGTNPLDVAYHARQKGLDDIITLPEMGKHLRLSTTLQGARKIRDIILSKTPDVIHCHMLNAHLLVGLASKNLKPEPLLIRTIYNPDGLGRDLRSRWCHRRATHGFIVVSEKARLSALAQAIPERAIEVIAPGIDSKRFSPNRELKQNLASLPPDGCFVAGAVSRIRKARRLDVILETVNELHHSYPGLRLLLVGRGRPGAFEEVIETPALKMGIRDKVIDVGYCLGDDLVAAYRRMHVLLYAVPGTDKTCRTVREALACGVPVIAPKIGFLPELIENGKNGYLVALSPKNFATALKNLMDSPDTLKSLSRGALETAQKKFAMQTRAEKTFEFYQRLMKDDALRPGPQKSSS